MSIDEDEEGFIDEDLVRHATRRMINELVESKFATLEMQINSIEIMLKHLEKKFDRKISMDMVFKDRMTEKQQKVFEMHKKHLKQTEIAKKLGMTQPAVHYALCELKAKGFLV